MPDDPRVQMQREIRALVEKHCQTLIAECQAIHDALPPQGQPGADLSPAIALIHKIKGSAGSIGFSDVGTAAEGLERLFRRDAAAAQGLSGEAAEAFARLKTMVQALTPEMSRLYNADFSGIAPLSNR